MPKPPLKPFWTTKDEKLVRLYHGDVLDVLRGMLSRSVQCVVTSPPYWGLRDYGTANWEGGKKGCNHLAPPTGGPNPVNGCKRRGLGNNDTQYKSICKKCEAKRIDSQLGSEETADCLGWATGDRCGVCHVCRITEVFREVRRVLREDGTLWLNYGDTYGVDSKKIEKGLPRGNLCGIPWRIALSLQADGWVLRQDIIWQKPNPMPESVGNRCTKAHEYIFLMAKGSYFYDAEAVRENDTGRRCNEFRRGVYVNNETRDNSTELSGSQGEYIEEGGRNKRSVWNVDDGQALLQWLAKNYPEALEKFVKESGNKKDVFNIATQSYPGAHYATFPEKLIEPCILAGTSEKGCCVRCGTPWKRVVDLSYVESAPLGEHEKYDGINAGVGTHPGVGRAVGNSKTLGWEPTCKCSICGVKGVKPCVVLDPFVGSGTVCCVSAKNGRRSIGIDLSEKYLLKNAIPRIEGVLMSIPKLHKQLTKKRKKVDAGDNVLE